MVQGSLGRRGLSTKGRWKLPVGGKSIRRVARHVVAIPLGGRGEDREETGKVGGEGRWGRKLDRQGPHKPSGSQSRHWEVVTVVPTPSHPPSHQPQAHCDPSTPPQMNGACSYSLTVKVWSLTISELPSNERPSLWEDQHPQQTPSGRSLTSYSSQGKKAEK